MVLGHGRRSGRECGGVQIGGHAYGTRNLWRAHQPRRTVKHDAAPAQHADDDRARRFHEAVYTLARYLMRNPDDAEDAVLAARDRRRTGSRARRIAEVTDLISPPCVLG
jgi:hypothetical protein